MEEDFRLYVFKLTKTHSIFLDCFLHKIMSNHHLRQLITSEKTWKQSKCFRGKSNPVLRPNARIIFIFTYLQPVTKHMHIYTYVLIYTCLHKRIHCSCPISYRTKWGRKAKTSCRRKIRYPVTCSCHVWANNR